MATGDKEKNSRVNSATNQAVKAATPYSYTDPFGSVNVNSKTKLTTFNPNESGLQADTRNTIDQSINNIVGQIPTSFDVNTYYNNPFYDTTRSMYRRTIDQDRERDYKTLQDNLNARNQIGSSYDALAQRYFNQDYGTRYDQADDQARIASANAYQQAYQNMLESLRGLSNERSSQLERTYTPAKIAAGYQSAVAPLQNSQAAAYNGLANYYGNQPTNLDRYMQLYGLVNDSAQQAAKAFAGGGGGG